MKRNSVLFALLLFLFLFLSSEMFWGEETLLLDMNQVLNAKEPKVVIYVLSLDVMIAVPIQEKRFDELLTTHGELCYDIYILEIKNPLVTKMLAKSLATTLFVPRHKTGDGFLDTRYKFCFFDGGQLLQVVYADVSGDISHNGKVWEGKTKKDKLWLYKFWENLRADLYIKPRLRGIH